MGNNASVIVPKMREHCAFQGRDSRASEHDRQASWAPDFLAFCSRVQVLFQKIDVTGLPETLSKSSPGIEPLETF
jgi:hypothetical protein